MTKTIGPWLREGGDPAPFVGGFAIMNEATAKDASYTASVTPHNISRRGRVVVDTMIEWAPRPGQDQGVFDRFMEGAQAATLKALGRTA